LYLPYGEEATAVAQDAERRKFTGHERDTLGTTDTADDRDNMHARHFNPLLGRFLSTDVFGGYVEQPQSLNRFAYVLGNPINYVDPDGMDPVRGVNNRTPPPVGMTVFDIGYGESLTVGGSAVRISYQPYPGNSFSIRHPTNAMFGPLGLLGRNPEPVDIGLFDRFFSSIPIQTNGYGHCVRAHRADPGAALVALGSAVPKAVVPPFRTPTFFSPATGAQSSRLTTPASVAAHYIGEVSPAAAGALRTGGRAVSKVATPLTLAEGAWDWGVLITCGF
jgi:RHS repeat-associated protein